MKAFLTIALAWAACALARAQAGPAARIGGLLSATPAPNGAELPPLTASPATPPFAAPAEAAPPLVPAGLWASLAPPDALTLAALAQRIPGFKTETARVLPFEAADAVFAEAVARGLSPLDLFTDSAFRADQVFFLTHSTIAALFERYEVRVLTPASGNTDDGKKFVMQALVIGGGRIDAMYNLDNFSFDNPLYPDYRYMLANRVTERIQGPGELTVEGVWIHIGLVTPALRRIVKLSPTQGRIETALGSRVKPVTAIRRR